MTRVLVTGGRDYRDRNAVFAALDQVHGEHGVTELISGGASGADSLARDWAFGRAIPHIVTEHADWTDLSHPDAIIRTNRYGQKYDAMAGPRRNQRMVERKPDIVVAFPGGDGTTDCVKRARAAGLEPIEIK